MSALLRLGGLEIHLDAGPSQYRELLPLLFRTLEEPWRDELTPDLHLRIFPRRGGSGFAAGNALEVERDGDRVAIRTELVSAALDLASSPISMDLEIDEDNQFLHHIDLYLRIVLNACLLQLDRVRLHAAAVTFAGSTGVFVGEKGAGKTTLSLYLGRAGGTILSEDQVMVHRTEDGSFTVAGGDDRMRLTAKTEAHFFESRLDITPTDYAGVPKKEVVVGEHFSSCPFEERRPSHLFFPQRGPRFEIRPLPRRRVVARLFEPLAPTYRFAGAQDRSDFLSFLAGFARQVECHDLILTSDLGDLAKLEKFLAR